MMPTYRPVKLLLLATLLPMPALAATTVPQFIAEVENSTTRVASLVGYDVIINQPLLVTSPKTIVVTGSRIRMNDSFNIQSSDVTIIGGEWTFHSGGIHVNSGGQGSFWDIRLENVRVWTLPWAGPENGFQMVGGGRLSILGCDMTSSTRSGVSLQSVTEVVVRGGRFNDNAWDGLHIGPGENIWLYPDETSRNGWDPDYTGSGINVSLTRNLKIGSPACNDNKEHGISFQGVDGFDVEWPVCKRNGVAGINLQDDDIVYNPPTPNSNGALGGHYRANVVGIRFMETNENVVIKSGTTSIQNCEAQVDFPHFGGSSRRSDKIVGRGLNLYSPPLNAEVLSKACKSYTAHTVTNRNVSVRVNITDKNNELRQFTAEKAAHCEIKLQDMPVTADLDPTCELVHVHGYGYVGGATLSRTLRADLIDGMVVTFCADDDLGFTLRRNADDGGGTYAPFVFTGPPAVTAILMGRNSCMTFRARGGKWLEVSRAIF